MTVYIDVVLLINFLLDLLILIGVTIILKRRVKIYRLFLSALFGSITIITLFLPMTSLLLFIFKLLTAVIMVLIAFSFKDIRYTMQNIFYLYLVSIVLGGCLYLINIQFYYHQDNLTIYNDGLSLNLVGIAILSPIIIWLYIKQTKKLKDNYSNYYPVSIYLKNNTIINVTGFRDTGNNLYDPYTRKPIILINNKGINLEQENIILVPYHALNTQSMLKCIKPIKVVIDGVGTKKKLLVGISTEPIKIEGVDCILHPKLF